MRTSYLLKTYQRINRAELDIGVGCSRVLLDGYGTVVSRKGVSIDSPALDHRSLFPGSVRSSLMSKRSAISFTRRAPDNLTEELVAVLSSKDSFEFKPLFEIILVNLRERNAANGGEECCALLTRSSGLVHQGAVNGQSQGPPRNTKALPSEWLCCAMR